MAIRPLVKQSSFIKRLRILHKRFREPLLTLLLSIQIFSLFVIPPLRSAGLPVPHMAIDGVLLIFVSLAIVLARRKSTLVMMTFSVVLTISGFIWHHEEPNFLTDTFSAAGLVLTQLSLLWVVSTAVFSRGPVTHHRILGGIVMYLCIGMIFANLDILLARTVPTSFTHLPANDFDLREILTYFSFSTLTTGSFGDVIPVHPIARSLANIESICGQLFPATLLARIVGLHSMNKDR